MEFFDITVLTRLKLCTSKLQVGQSFPLYKRRIKCFCGRNLIDFKILFNCIGISIKKHLPDTQKAVQDSSINSEANIKMMLTPVTLY